jgi:hypothetical protein
MAFGNRVQAHGINAGWVGLRPPVRPPYGMDSLSCSFWKGIIRLRLRHLSWPERPNASDRGSLRAYSTISGVNGTISHEVDPPFAYASGPEAHDAARRWLAGGVLRPCPGTRAAPAPVPDHSPPPLHPAPTTSRGRTRFRIPGPRASAALADGWPIGCGHLQHIATCPSWGLRLCPVTAFGRSPAHCGSVCLTGERGIRIVGEHGGYAGGCQRVGHYRFAGDAIGFSKSHHP